MSIWFDGKWIEESEAKISIFDLSVLRGFGVFDFLRTYNRKPFQMSEHIDRLIASAEEVGLEVPKSKSELEALVAEGLSRTNPDFPELYIKLILTGGVADDAISPVPGRQSLILTFQKAGVYSPESFTHGIKLMTYPYERYLPKAKSLNYMAGVVALQKAKKEGAQEILFVSSTGVLLEGATVNFFAVIKGKIYTAEESILYGITRNFIFHVIKKENLGIEIVTGELHTNQMEQFEEAFIASTTREVMPVTIIDGKPVGNGAVGPVTKKVMDAFSKVAREMCN